MREFPGWMKLTLVLIMAVLALGGTWLYRSQERSQLADVENTLASIGLLKAEQITAWRAERLGDAGLLMESPFVNEGVAALLGGRDVESPTASLLGDFESLCRQYGYEDVLLVTPDGTVRLSAGDVDGRIADISMRALEQAFDEGRPTLTDLHIGETHTQPHLSAVAPFFETTVSGRRPLAAILLVSDAPATLYPIIQSRPVPSRSAETLLVCRDGDDVLFLNDLRHQSGTALTLRIPLSRADLPAVSAVTGRYGVVRGRDYRGEDVMAVVLPVPGSSWAIVSKVDASEALTGWRFRSAVILILVVGLMTLLAVAAFAALHVQRSIRYRTLYESEAVLRVAEERYGITLRSIGDAVIATDGQGLIEIMNPVAEKLTGWSGEAARGRPLEEVFEIVNERTGASVDSPVDRVLRDGVIVGLANHTLLIRRDGVACPIADSGAAIMDAEQNITGVVVVFRDMTEERRRESELQDSLGRQNHLLGVLGAIRDVNQLITRESDRDRLVQGACECMSRRLEGGSACIALVDRDGNFAGLGHAGEGGQFEQAKESLDRGEWPECASAILQSSGLVAMPQPSSSCCRPDSCSEEQASGSGGDRTGGDAAFGIRLEHEGRVYGLFTATVPEAYVDDEEERSLFVEMAGDVAFALAKIEAAERRRELEEKYDAALATTSDAVIVIDLDGNIQAFNLGAEALFGYGADEIIGTHISRLSPQEGLEEQRTIIQQARKSGSIQGFVCERVRKDGTRVPVEVTLNLRREPDGAPVGFVSIVRNISERVAAESALLEQQRILDQTGRMARIGGWEHELETGEAVWTAALYDIIGIEPGTRPPGANEHLDYYPPEHRKRLEEAYGRAARDGTPFDLELQAHTSSGELLWCRVYGEPVYANGRCVRLRGTFQDITTLKQAERELRSQEEKYRLLADNTVDVIWMIGLDARFLYVNPASEALLGARPEEIVGAGLWEYCDEDTFAMMQGEIEKTLAALPNIRVAVFEAEMRKRDGTPVQVEITGKALTDEQGRPVALQGVTRNISERKLAEEEREELRQQLSQAQKMESVGRLAGGVAHDFNNMLQVILGNTEIALRRESVSKELQDDLAEIKGAAQSSANLTRQLLAFARRQTVAPRILDLNETVSATLKMLRRLIGEDIELTWRPGASLAAVMLDPSQVDQMLANLCVNARDAIEGIGRIDISTGNVVLGDEYCSQHPEVIRGEHVMLSLSDDGCGMDATTLADIFEPFFTTKGLGQGTGLGLSTVYGIIRQNSGSIDVESAVGEGTTFRIYLPICESAAEELGEEARPAEHPKGDGERVLLVEDEIAILHLCEAVLGELGYSVSSATTPGEALRVAQQMKDSGGIDLLITDVIMPEMNGRDLADRIRELSPGVRTLFMSGYTADIIAKRGVLDKGVSFIQKPFTVEGIATKVREALG